MIIKAPCDPKNEECLSDECDAESGDCDEQTVQEYYKLVEIKAADINE